jgi:hypothetical protein
MCFLSVMCCFSGNVSYVKTTRIFARMTARGRQSIAYQMRLGSDRDLAMILPIPVVPGSGADAVRFIDLSGYPRFFSDLAAGFFGPMREAPPASLAYGAAAPLKVHEVGAYEASYVPSIADFRRLDERFRLAEGVWEKLPQFHDYGFAVFKLRKGEMEVHPMAFEFPTRHEDRLFFPTVHIHDGEVHAMEDFDHTLYCQVSRRGLFAMLKWDETAGLAGGFSKPELSGGLLREDAHVHRRVMVGRLRNQDLVLGTA